MLHELWDDGTGGPALILAGPRGDAARAALLPGAKLAWTVEAASWSDAMTRYHEHMGWTAYRTFLPDAPEPTYRELGWE